MVPSVSVLTGFDGMCFFLSTARLICDEISCGIIMWAVDVIWDQFCEIPPLLNIRVPIKFYFTFLFCQYCVIFFVEKCKGASFVWQDLWENWISWEGLLWFTLHWWEGWPGTVTAGITVVKINWKILCNINVHYWLLQSLSKCALKRNMTVHDLCYGILTES